LFDNEMVDGIHKREGFAFRVANAGWPSVETAQLGLQLQCDSINGERMTTYFIVLIFVSSSIIFGGTEVNSMSLMFNLRLASPIITTLRMWKRF